MSLKSPGRQVVGDFDARAEDTFVAENMKENFRHKGREGEKRGEMPMPPIVGGDYIFILLLISSDVSFTIMLKSFRIVRIRSLARTMNSSPDESN